MQSLLKINGVVIKTPSTFQITYQDYDSDTTGRTADGTLVRERICTKRRLDVGWRVLYADEMATILQNTSDMFFTVEFLDAKTNSFQTITAYVGDRVPSAYTVRDDVIIYTDFTIGLIEK